MKGFDDVRTGGSAGSGGSVGSGGSAGSDWSDASDILPGADRGTRAEDLADTVVPKNSVAEESLRISQDSTDFGSSQDSVEDSKSRSPRRLGLRLTKRFWLIVVLLLVATVGGLYFWYQNSANPPGKLGKQVVVQVGVGEPLDTAISTLAAHRVISSALAFKISDLIDGTPALIPGGYLFRTNESFSSVKSILSNGPDVFTLQVFPGLTLKEVANQLGKLTGRSPQTFLSLASSGAVHSPWQAPGSNSLEGLLGAGSYVILPNESDKTILTDLVDRFDTDASQAGLTQAVASKFSLSLNQLVTVASIVEKEGYIYKNMPQVARVIYNRLSKAMPLQMDSTVLYSLGQDGGPVTQNDLRLNTPYNTYLHSGLPPTPICVPSLQAMQAAADPPAGSWLYFVVISKNGTEAFATTFATQLANEKLANSRGLG